MVCENTPCAGFVVLRKVLPSLAAKCALDVSVRYPFRLPVVVVGVFAVFEAVRAAWFSWFAAHPEVLSLRITDWPLAGARRVLFAHRSHSLLPEISL